MTMHTLFSICMFPETHLRSSELSHFLWEEGTAKIDIPINHLENDVPVLTLALNTGVTPA